MNFTFFALFECSFEQNRCATPYEISNDAQFENHCPSQQVHLGRAAWFSPCFLQLNIKLENGIIIHWLTNYLYFVMRFGKKYCTSLPTAKRKLCTTAPLQHRSSIRSPC